MNNVEFIYYPDVCTKCNKILPKNTIVRMDEKEFPFEKYKQLMTSGAVYMVSAGNNNMITKQNKLFIPDNPN